MSSALLTITTALKQTNKAWLNIAQYKQPVSRFFDAPEF